MEHQQLTTDDADSLPAAGGFLSEENDTPVRNDGGIAKEMGVVQAAVQNDPAYAWGWHCSLAMAFVDEGVAPAVANRGAARFMHMLFGVDTSKHEHYHAPYGSPNLPVVLPDGSSFFTGEVALLKDVHPDHDGLAVVGEPIQHVQV